MALFESILRSLNQVFEAGVAITALSLFIRALSFNLRDRVSRSFAIVLACVMFVFTGEAVGGAVNNPEMIPIWVGMQWVGILFLPAALQHFSDSLLATTGRPSRGRRRALIFLSYLFSLLLVIGMSVGFFLDQIVISEAKYPQLISAPVLVSAAFSLYYLGSVVMSAVNIWRAYRRTKLTASRRRISYLLVGVVFLAIGSYPYMHLGSSFALGFPVLFISLVVFGNVGIFSCLLIMAYAVAFFGVSWPDRVVRNRLLKWLLRGPITVFIMLLLLTVAIQVSDYFGDRYTVAVPIISVISVMLTEHLITLAYPYLERTLFHQEEDEGFYLIQNLSDRLVSKKDLRQFLDAIMAAICDQFQVSTGFVAASNEEGWEIVFHVGEWEAFKNGNLEKDLVKKVPEIGGLRPAQMYSWGDFWVFPLYTTMEEKLIGMIGVLKNAEQEFDPALIEPLKVLGHRATQALEDRILQKQLFVGMEELSPKAASIQRLRAASRFDQSEIYRELNEAQSAQELTTWVKDALSHYWGGPKLSESPLASLQVVRGELAKHDGNSVNALRSVLRRALEQVKPAGEKKFTPEWILFNILELKFIEGHKVREIASRLAVSEADLYRKQRIA
ncbi:MAG: histidine kinase N-terminal 7TM domain-containing protein, partial [Chloroflexota bacterium]